MNEMMSNDTTFSWGWVIFLILILWFFVGGNGFGFGGYGNRAGSFLAGDILGQLQGRDASLSCGASNCEVERRGLITAAEIFLSATKVSSNENKKYKSAIKKAVCTYYNGMLIISQSPMSANVSIFPSQTAPESGRKTNAGILICEIDIKPQYVLTPMA